MRKFLIPLAAAASAIVVASPASAQWAPSPYGYPAPQAYGYAAPQAYGYGAPQAYGYGYGYGNVGQVRALQARIDQVQGRLDMLRARRLITPYEYSRLHAESHWIERRLRAVASYGLNQREAYDVQARIARLQSRVNYEVRDGRSGYGDYHGRAAYGYNAYRDRDRDGRDDRYEDDRGYRRD